MKKNGVKSNYSEWKKAQKTHLIRFRTVEYIDPEWGDGCLDYEFEVFKKPYFFGLFGEKQWCGVIQTNDLGIGYNYCEHIIGISDTGGYQPIITVDTTNPPQECGTT